ncbi:hypothetical protein BpHYR1_002571 [Brachionus plicatilis]|uniref:Uncharacterized protein n=1 Tax=Brachionus plicatilis TaxID=10195 RepID=A0A3M7RH84_BRAPC|nr:hypothetical protein BpHYR1_002571 [Brachionus plicatilis]
MSNHWHCPINFLYLSAYFAYILLNSTQNLSFTLNYCKMLLYEKHYENYEKQRKEEHKKKILSFEEKFVRISFYSTN